MLRAVQATLSNFCKDYSTAYRDEVSTHQESTLTLGHAVDISLPSTANQLMHPPDNL
ncbi:hypothetical protein [Escherichia phage vB-EcoP-XT73]|nr:hypothetical protein [Escherichia phage vB-EcoP-XT32]WPK42141.1 hypothetical protein [Escherichia phage vB-EcoP-XT73]